MNGDGQKLISKSVISADACEAFGKHEEIGALLKEKLSRLHSGRVTSVNFMCQQNALLHEIAHGGSWTDMKTLVQ